MLGGRKIGGRKVVDLNQVRQDIRQYEREHFGAKCGPEFQKLAADLVQLDDFNLQLFIILMDACMASGHKILQKIPAQTAAGEKAAPAINSAFRGSFLQQQVLELFYWGYLAGKQQAEIERLNNMITEPDQPE